MIILIPELNMFALYLFLIFN